MGAHRALVVLGLGCERERERVQLDGAFGPLDLAELRFDLREVGGGAPLPLDALLSLGYGALGVLEGVREQRGGLLPALELPEAARLRDQVRAHGLVVWWV